jgi:hypothetical protein
MSNQSFQRRSAPIYVRDAILNALGLMPGHGMYRADAVRVLGLFILTATDQLAGDHNLGCERTAQALRRLADAVERGEDLAREAA